MKKVLLATFSLTLSLSAYSQDSITQAETSSHLLGNPVRIGVDLSIMGVGTGGIFVTKIKLSTERTKAAQTVVDEINARMWREAPELAEAKQKFQAVHERRTFEETAADRKALNDLANLMNRTSGVQDAKMGKARVLSEETINILTNGAGHVHADLIKDNADLISLSEKTAMLKEAQGAITAAEKINAIQRKNLEIELAKATHSLELEESLALRRIIRFNKWYYRIGGGFLIIAGGWDLYRTIMNNTVTTQVPTPDELGKMASVIMAGKSSKDFE